MKINKTMNIVIKVGLLWFISMAAYSSAILRVVCLDSDTGITVYINDKKKGNCPSDFVVAAGDIQLRAVKVVDVDHEQVFEENFFIADNNVKKIRVRLSEARLNAAAAKRELLARLQKEKQFAELELAKAQNGDIEAMNVLVGLYQSGKGVTKSLEKSESWKHKAIETQEYNNAMRVLQKAENGDLQAIDQTIEIYTAGNGLKADAEKAQMWRDKKATILKELDEKYAQEMLKKAQAGDINSMQIVAKLYKAGEGIEQSLTKAQEWGVAHTQALNEYDLRESKASEVKKKKEELAKIDYFEGVEFGWLATTGKGQYNPILATTMSPIGLLITVADFLSAPYKTTKQIMLQNEIDAHAAQWGAPDAMVSKASQQN